LDDLAEVSKGALSSLLPWLEACSQEAVKLEELAKASRLP